MKLESLFTQKRLRKVWIMCTLLCLIFITALSQSDNSSKLNENSWSGTITYISTLRTYHAAPYSEFIYKKWSHLYEQHMVAKLVNGKGIGTSNISLIDTNYNRDQTGGKIVEQWETEKGNAEGSADTEASIAINTSDKPIQLKCQSPKQKEKKSKPFYAKVAVILLRIL